MLALFLHQNKSCTLPHDVIVTIPPARSPAGSSVGSTSADDTVLDTGSAEVKLWLFQSDDGMFDLFVDIKVHFGGVDGLIAKELESH